MMKQINKQTGFTLLEVLISMLVLSIGLLGIAGLQASSLQYGLDSSSRAQVTILAEDILSKMRMQTNKAPDTAIPATIASYLAAPAGVCNPVGVGIPAELACWHAAVAANLPNGVAVITAPAGGRSVNIQISWFEQGTRSYETDTAAVAGTDGDALREGTRFFNLTANL